MIPKSSVILLSLFFLHFSFGWGEGQVTQRIFFFFNFWNLFQQPAKDLHWNTTCMPFAFLKPASWILSRVMVFTEPAQPITCLKKICLHFEVPFECHSLDLSSILFHCYIQAPHKSTMRDSIESSRLWKKLVGLHWGREGNKICVLLCLI